MKHFFTALTLALPLVTPAQDFNMNKVAGTYMQDGQKLYSCPNRNVACEWQVSRTDLPGTDAEGNPLVSFELAEKKNAFNTSPPDTVLFLPDNPVYPVQMQLFYHKNFVNYYRPSFDDNGQRMGSAYVGGSTVYIAPGKNTAVINRFSGMTHNHLTWESKWARNTKEELKAAYTSDTKRAGAEVYHYMDVMHAFLLKKIEAAADMDYDQEVQDFLSSGGTYYMINPSSQSYGSGRVDAFQVVWPASGDKSSFQMNFPFTDGNYYDKEQFLFTVKKNNSFSGMYEYNHPTLVVNSGLLVPFEGVLIVVTKCDISTANQPNGKRYCPVGVITKDLTHPWLLSIRNESFINMDWVTAVTNSATYEYWQMKQELTTSYDYKKDLFRLPNFLMQYVSAMMQP